ncbi:hypothetical protein L6452_39089 [Arctium lappa]|uniref:Uncharacterized protein n=1 Tax=Arctium lappa TaxID=4217 RepID=A0ACB8XRW2_ARCLA|nr:hypothetical protein L6452_39089 [Arctium lappa]
MCHNGHTSATIRTTTLSTTLFMIRPKACLPKLDFDTEKYPHLVDTTAFLKQSCLAFALTMDPKPYKTLLQQFWFTADETIITNKKGEVVPTISFTTELGSSLLTAYGLCKALRFSEKTKAGFDALPTYVELIQFLDDMEYCWDNKPCSTIPNKRLIKIQKENMPSQLNYIFSHIIQSMSGKIGSLDPAGKVQLQMGYSVIAGKHFDYAGAIFDDLKSKIEKTERDPKIPYVRFICAYLHFLYAEKYPTSSDAATQGVPSFTIPTATTTSKRPSTALSGPSKKAKKTKETIPSGSIPEVVSQQTTLDKFVGISSTASVATTSTVPVMTIVVTTPVTTPISSVPPQQQTEVESLTTSVNESTNAVNQAGEELKKLTATSSSKVDTSIIVVQEDIVKIKEDLVGTHQQRMTVHL